MPYSRPHISTFEQVLPNVPPSDQLYWHEVYTQKGKLANMVGDYMAYWHKVYTQKRNVRGSGQKARPRP